MFKNKNFKKSVLVLVAVLMCALLVFTACNPTNAFKPVEMPASAAPEGNGGIAVKYGDWIYYVNGYQSSASADNSYTSDIRVGAIVRIKIADLEDVIKINDQDLSSTKKAEAITKAVAQKAEMVVPNFYFNGNTSAPALNGINIFNDRIYITTPNNQLDANGNYLSSQLVLASYKLDGSDMQRHYVFTSNAPQLKLTQSGNDVVATYILDNNLYTLKLGDSEAKTIVESISSATFTGDNIYFLDKDGSICKYTIGATEHKVVVLNEVEEGHEGHNHGTSYSIKSVNGDYVYYTVSDSSQTSGLKLFYATSEKSGEIALDTIPTSSYYGWKDGVIFTTSVPEESVTMYGIWTASGDGSDIKEILDASKNDNAITFNKLDGNVLHYTVASVSYTLDLADENAQPIAYAYGLSQTATGWALPDVLGSYVFSLSSGSVSVVKFNAETKKNSASSTITFTLVEESKD